MLRLVGTLVLYPLSILGLASVSLMVTMTGRRIRTSQLLHTLNILAGTLTILDHGIILTQRTDSFNTGDAAIERGVRSWIPLTFNLYTSSIIQKYQPDHYFLL